ncbi:MAG: hypothetical protein CSA65_05135 [Proteobacteria bacterium]|nr:MAG: hypothetical protein CSA65_05135 [Pseudomonadota bacterium]
MFKFLFRRKSDQSVEVTKETQRETLLRAIGEVNEITATLDDKPAVTVDPNTGAITLTLPEQMPDEALALPAPEEALPEPEMPEAEDTPAKADGTEAKVEAETDSSKA